MATHLRENLGLEVVADVLDATAAALECGSQTTMLAANWALLTARADELAQARRKLDRDGRRARVQLAVRDAEWDATVAAFGRAVVDASGGKRDQAPYTRFFAKSAPSLVQEFGSQREVDQARGWLAELGRNPDEPLAQTWLPRLGAATLALEAAVAERDRAAAALGPHQTTARLFVDEINRALDVLEGDLKKLFPGQPERVASHLCATRLNRPSEPSKPLPDADKSQPT
jgi:hypothetical protein